MHLDLVVKNSWAGVESGSGEEQSLRMGLFYSFIFFLSLLFFFPLSISGVHLSNLGKFFPKVHEWREGRVYESVLMLHLWIHQRFWIL